MPPDVPARLLVAVDVGGTFTDVVIVSGEQVEALKVPSTPSDPSIGVVDGIRAGLGRIDRLGRDVELLTHATTVATNALLEHGGTRVGLLVTDGHRDILEIARLRRRDPLDLSAKKLPALVGRAAIREIPERLGVDGTVVRVLDDADVERAFEQLDEMGVDAFAVSFLHGYRHVVHEQRAAATLRQLAGDRPVFASYEVVPQAREYERTSTTVVAAYLASAVSGYLRRLGERLREHAIPPGFLVMRSNGGLASAEHAAGHPEELVESGPAAGVVGAANSGVEVGLPDLISFDMGGTTAKAALVIAGAPRLSFDYEVGGETHSGDFLQKGVGYPLRVPVVDLAEVGTGGGSIAWVDPAGALRVGPRSAGSEPGPACYGRGGELPTVTDADLVLGLLRADGPGALGGLDAKAARRSIEVHIAGPLGLSAEAGARGIFELATAQMADAVRLVSVARGHDARLFAMVPFGGAGPVHAWAIARHLGIAKLIVPPLAGVFSAVGLLKADVRVDTSQGTRITLGDSAGAGSSLLELSERARRSLGGRAAEYVHFDADVRYRGQSYELTIPVALTDTGELDEIGLEAAFHEAHKQAYGHARPDHGMEILALRAHAVTPNGASEGLAQAMRERSERGDHPESSREIDFGDGPIASTVMSRGGFGDRWRQGPCAVEQDDTTVIIPLGARARLLDDGHLEVEL